MHLARHSSAAHGKRRKVGRPRGRRAAIASAPRAVDVRAMAMDQLLSLKRQVDGQPMHRRHQATLALIHLLFIPLTRPRLANGPADPPAGIAQPISKIRYRLPPTGRAQEFFELYSIASLMISRSIRWSAMILRSRWFSF